MPARSRSAAFLRMAGPSPPGWTCSPTTSAALADNVRYRASLTDEEANILLAAYVLHGHGEYDSWRQDHLDAEQVLKDSGLLHSQNGPHRVSLDDDVRFSLDHRPSAPSQYPCTARRILSTAPPSFASRSAVTECHPH